MINFFQMITATGGTGINLSDNTKTGGNNGESLFSILLSNMNGSTETSGGSSGLSLLMSALPAGSSIIADEDLSPAINSGIITDKTEKHHDKTSFQSSDLLLPESAMPDLASFLENKGFSTEQIDSILLSSLNEDGQIQMHKLATAIHSAEKGTLSDATGVTVDASYIPKVQELLFNMGMGVGEVTEIIEKSKNETGGVSLDKLTEALNEGLVDSITKTELVSLLEK
ncbi:MAG: hypothetical protein JW944_08210, partial [Deltaproteobacteria bacterium]|nr:hypothetical protein [Deltaproteobacteria bacterium]